jgi:uncharacterized delta-60 repeat protein
MRNALLGVLLLLAASSRMWAQPIASYDSTFSSDGRHHPGLQLNTARAAYLLDTSGNILICGHNDTVVSTSRVVRLLADGSALDTNWQTSVVDIPGYTVNEQDYIWAQSGKIMGVAKARLGTGDYSPVVWRLLPDGTPDSTFGVDASTMPFLSFNDVFPWKMAVSSDSITILACGEGLIGGHYNGMLVAMDPLGDLITGGGGFDGDGIWFSPLGSDDLIHDLEFKSDGNLLFCGQYMPVPAVTQSYVGLIDDRADLVTSFGSGGYVDFPPADSFAGLSFNTLTQQPDGKVLAAGIAKDPGFFRDDFLVARFLDDGTPDTSFSGDGYLLTNVGGNATLRDLVLQPDGKILVGGTVTTSGGFTQFVFARYLPNGDLDTNVLSDGILLVDPATEVGGEVFDLNNMALMADGRIVAGGTYKVGAPPMSVVMRFLPNLEILLHEQDFHSSAAELLIYPNPVAEVLHVQLPEGAGSAQFELVDLQGRTLHQWQPEAGKASLPVPQGLSAGQYLLKVTTAQGEAWVRWIKD